jgi:hypothetical protein
LTEQNKKF